MGKIKAAIGRLPFIPWGSNKKDFVQGSVRRRLEQPINRNMLGLGGDLEANSDVIAALLNSQVASLCGDGVAPVLDTGDERLDERLMRLFEVWSDQAELSGLTFDDAIKLCVRLWIRDGGSLILLDPSGRIQLLGYDDIADIPDSKGIEVDSAAKPVAYHFKAGVMESVRVPAESVLHIATRVRQRQVRGQSMLWPSYQKVIDLQAYDTAEMESSAAAAKTAFVVRSENATPVMPRNQAGNLDSEAMPSGIIFDRLRPGESVEVISATRPNPELSNYRAAILRAIAAATQSSYSSIARESAGSFSSARHLTVLEERDHAVLHSQLVRTILNPLWRFLVTGWSRSGQVALTEATRYRALRPKRWPNTGVPAWIDPSKQADAAVKLQKAGIFESSELRTHFSGFSQ